MSSKKDMLGVAVRKLVTLPNAELGVVCDLLEKMADPEWGKATKLFLRKEDPWPSSGGVIDCDAQPYIPRGWTVVEHQKGGKLEWDFLKIQLYLSDSQRSDGLAEGHIVRRNLYDQKPLNANVLEGWLADNSRIPKDVCIACQEQGKQIFFWNTIYRSPDHSGTLYNTPIHRLLLVRCLFWNGNRWCDSFKWLKEPFRSSDPAAVLASE